MKINLYNQLTNLNQKLNEASDETEASFLMNEIEKVEIIILRKRNDIFHRLRKVMGSYSMIPTDEILKDACDNILSGKMTFTGYMNYIRKTIEEKYKPYIDI